MVEVLTCTLRIFLWIPTLFHIKSIQVLSLQLEKLDTALSQASRLSGPFIIHPFIREQYRRTDWFLSTVCKKCLTVCFYLPSCQFFSQEAVIFTFLAAFATEYYLVMGSSSTLTLQSQTSLLRLTEVLTAR